MHISGSIHCWTDLYIDLTRLYNSNARHHTLDLKNVDTPRESYFPAKLYSLNVDVVAKGVSFGNLRFPRTQTQQAEDKTWFFARVARLERCTKQKSFFARKSEVMLGNKDGRACTIVWKLCAGKECDFRKILGFDSNSPKHTRGLYSFMHWHKVSSVTIPNQHFVSYISPEALVVGYFPLYPSPMRYLTAGNASTDFCHRNSRM